MTWDRYLQQVMDKINSNQFDKFWFGTIGS